MTYSIEQRLTNVNKGKKGTNKPEYIVVHFVGASGQAMANAIYFESMYRGASAGYFVDPNEIIQVVEDDTPSWSVGDGSRTLKGAFNGYVIPGGATNTNVISIELCQDVTTGSNVWNWEFHPETINRAEWLIRKLQVEHDIDDDHVIRHHDVSGKLCPGNWQYNDWAKWWALKDRLEKDIIQVKPSSRPPVDEGKRDESNMYLVHVGDTLSGISRKYNITVDELVKWNDIDNPNLIFPETKLFIKAPNVDKPTVAGLGLSVHIEQMARDVLAGKYGNGEERRDRLGKDYNAVQAVVNDMLRGTSKPKADMTKVVVVGTGANNIAKELLESKSIIQLADEVMKGMHGNGQDRMKSLGANYTKVQAEVNRRLRK